MCGTHKIRPSESGRLKCMMPRPKVQQSKIVERSKFVGDYK